MGPVEICQLRFFLQSRSVIGTFQVDVTVVVVTMEIRWKERKGNRVSECLGFNVSPCPFLQLLPTTLDVGCSGNFPLLSHVVEEEIVCEVVCVQHEDSFSHQNAGGEVRQAAAWDSHG